jgi:hypothetical protein
MKHLSNCHVIELTFNKIDTKYSNCQSEDHDSYQRWGGILSKYLNNDISH